MVTLQLPLGSIIILLPFHMSTVHLLLLSSPPKPPPPHHHHSQPTVPNISQSITRRSAIIATSIVSLSTQLSVPMAASQESNNSFLDGILNIKSWFLYYGDGFSIRVPPLFEDIMEPEDFSAGFSYYGDKAKTKTYLARFASPDRSEVLSVIMRPSNQLKITFLEAKDITDLGTLKQAAKIFVPGGAKLYSARTIKVKDDESLRTYYLYEFGIDTQRVALVATVNSGKAYIVGAAAPQTKWEDDGAKLRSAAISLSIL